MDERAWLERLVTVCGKRCTQRQKGRFLSFVSGALERSGCTVTLDRGTGAMGRSCTNLYIGDVRRAKRVVCAPYDTASRLLLPGYRYFPLDRRGNLRAELVWTGLQDLLALLVLGLAGALLLPLLRGEGPWRAGAMLLLAAVALVCFRLFGGVPNRYNFTRNSAGAAVLLSLAEEHRGDAEVAFALLDRATASFEGYGRLREYLGGDGKDVLVLDCVGAGQALFLARSGDGGLPAGVRGVDLDEAQRAETPLAFFPRGTILCGGEPEGERPVVRHTRSAGDSRIDFQELERARSVAASLIGRKSH